MTAKIILISGACGTGKTSISRILAENSDCELTAHIHTDDFYQYIRKGYLAPWQNGSGDQNETVVEAAAACAERYSAGGYEVFVDGMIGPWFLKTWIRIAESGTDVRYVVLRPGEQTTVLRAAEREQRDCFPLTSETIKNIWQSMTDLGQYEANAVNTTGQTAEESAALIQKLLRKGAFRL